MHRRRWATRVDRFLVDAERTVELRDQRPAEAGGKRAARRTDDLADALEADAIERGDGVMVEAKRGQRQWRQHRPAAAGRHHDGRIGSETGSGGRRARRVGDGGAGVEALCVKAGDEIGDKRRFASEKMRATGDVEHQAMVAGVSATSGV